MSAGSMSERADVVNQEFLPITEVSIGTSIALLRTAPAPRQCVPTPTSNMKLGMHRVFHQVPRISALDLFAHLAGNRAAKIGAFWPPWPSLTKSQPPIDVISASNTPLFFALDLFDVVLVQLGTWRNVCERSVGFRVPHRPSF